MIRIVIAAATLLVIVAIGVTIWLGAADANRPSPSGAGEVPRQYDTTGGREMRPQWNGAGQ